MQKILMVCLGNICRSPMAEGIMRHLAAQEGVDIYLDSAGTNSYHTGEPPDHRAIRCMTKHGIDITGLRARSFEEEDFDTFDLILTMDPYIHSEVLKLARSKHDGQKVELFLAAGGNTTSHKVPDPYFGKDQHFEEVFELILEHCKNILSSIQNKTA